MRLLRRSTRPPVVPSGRRFPALQPPLLSNRRQLNPVLDVAAFILPLGLAGELALGGRIFWSELLILCLAPLFLADFDKLSRDPFLRRIAVLGLIWLVSQVATDIIRDTPFEDYSRGWARIGFFLLNFYAVSWLAGGQDRRLALMLAGIVGSYVLKYFVDPPELAGLFAWWKLYWVLPAGILFGLAACATRNAGAQVGIATLGVLKNWLLYGRAMGGVFCITAVLLFVRGQYLRGVETGQTVTRKLRLHIPIAIAVVGLVIMPLFVSLAMDGYFGPLEMDRTINQVQAGQQYIGGGVVGQFFGLLIGGRNEIIVSTQAILDSPVIGHGSWAKNITYLDLYAALGGIGIDEYRQQAGHLFDMGLIPTHSHLFGGWVEAGIGGAICWLGLLWLFYQAMIGAVVSRSRFAPVFLLVIVLELWDIVFSPFGAERRFTEAVFLACACHVLREQWILSKAGRPPHR